MIDIELLRKNFDEVSKHIQSRHRNYPQLEEFKAVDKKWRDVIFTLQQLKTKHNALTKQIGTLFIKNKHQDAKSIKSEIQKIKGQIAKLEQDKKELDEQFKLILLSIPNVPHKDVPIGKDEKDNIEVRRWGDPKEFKFKPQAHWDLGTSLKWLDAERSTKLSGSRFNIYLNDGAKLIRILQWFTLEMNIKASFKELLPPVILNAETLYGTGQLPKFEDDLFKLTNNQFLSPTAEVQLTSFYRNEILDEKQLPIYLTANTSCFRSEAGSAGKDTRGVIRQHQFYKTEMVMIVNPLDSYDHLETMVQCAENILKKLELPYKTIVLCTGDMGFASAKTYDIEVWLPSYNGYKEISSCSNCESFQARNLLLRYRDLKTKTTQYPHTLNGSGLAIDRLWAAVVENYQQADGSIKIPEELRKYFDNQEYLGKHGK